VKIKTFQKHVKTNQGVSKALPFLHLIISTFEILLKLNLYLVEMFLFLRKNSSKRLKVSWKNVGTPVRGKWGFSAFLLLLI
jgi:hypothetical protein